MKITIKDTQNPTILKFEFPDFITQNESFEFKNIDEAKNSPLAQQLFYLPFVKTIYISGNFIAIDRYNIVEWDDVKDAVAEQIDRLVGRIMLEHHVEVGHVVGKPIGIGMGALRQAEAAPVGGDDVPVALQAIDDELERGRHIHPAVYHE